MQKGPLFGVIGIQSGPQHRGPTLASVIYGSRGWDAGRGDDFEDCRAFFVQGKSIKAICRELRVPRKVVRKVIRSEATEFRYEREAQPLPKIGPWRDKLDQLLLANEGKASRERLTLIRLFEELRELGYDGGYDAVRRYGNNWRKARGASTAAAYVPLSCSR